jgi:competence protein ComFB
MTDTIHTEKPINLVKLIAEELAPSVLERMGIDNNDQNLGDVLALALNSLPTKYVTTASGRQYAKLVEVYRVQYETDVISALTKASMKVKDRPRDSHE